MYFIQRIGVFLLILLVLVACNSSEPPSETVAVDDVSEVVSETVNDTVDSVNEEADESSNTIVTFAVNDYERGLYANHIEAFQQANPSITIELISMGEITEDPYILYYESDEKIMETALDLVKSADVLAISPPQVMIDQELILNLEPLIASDGQMKVDDFFPGILEKHQQDGGTWALPLVTSYNVIVYDKNLFDAANVPYPEPGWNWADFVATAQALTDLEGETVQWGFTTNFSYPIDFIEARAGRPFIDETTQPPTINFEHPDVVAAFQWYADLVHVHGVMPTNEEEENLARSVSVGFGNNGRGAAMWIENTAFMSTASLGGDNLGMVPFPSASPEDKTSPISPFRGSGNSLVISAGSTKIEEAWAWLKFLSQQSSERGFFDSAALPARQSAAEASGFWDDLDDNFADTLRYAVNHTFVPSEMPRDTFLPLHQIIDLQEDVATVLAEVQTEVEEAMQKQTDAVAESTPVPSFTVAEPPSSQVPEGATVVKFVIMGAAPDIYREIAKSFQETHPDIVVKIEEPNYFDGDFSVAALMGEGDCFQSFSSLDDPDDLAAILSVQPFLDADPELAESDFYPALLDAFRKQGQIMGLPGEAMMRILAYDKRLFDAVDQPYPSSGWTMDEFLETTVALTQGDGEEKIYGFRPSAFNEASDLIMMMEQLGAQFIDEGVDPVQMSFTHPDTIAAMRWYTNLTTEYGVKPLPDDSGMFGRTVTFSDESLDPAPGNIAIWADENFGVFFGPDDEDAPEQDTSHIGYVLYPTGVSGSANYENVTGFFISAKTQHRQACWEWIKYLSSEPAVFQFGTPAHIGTSESTEYVQRVGAEKAAIFRDALSSSDKSSEFNRFSRSASWISLSIAWLEEAHKDVVLNDVSVEDAMQQAQNKSDAFRDCVIERDIFSDFEKQFECLSEIDPNLFG